MEDFEHTSGQGEKRLTVEDAMVIFKSCLDDEKRCDELGGDLLGLSLALAHTCRESLGRSWGYEVKQLEGDYQQLALDYRNKVWQRQRQRKEDPGTPGYIDPL